MEKREAVEAIKRMRSNLPVSDDAYYDIAETLDVFKTSYRYFQGKRNHYDITEIVDHIETASREEAGAAFATLVSFEHLSEGLLEIQKKNGNLGKIIDRIIETNDGGGNKEGQEG